MHPSKVPHAVFARCGHVLEIPPHERFRGEGEFPAASSVRLGVGKGDFALAHLDDALVGDGGALHIAGEVTQHGRSGAGGLDIDVPVRRPHPVRHLGVQGRRRRAQPVAEGLAEGCGDGTHGQEPVRLPAPLPAFAVGSQAAAGHDDVQVRVMLELPSPRVQDGKQSQFAAKMALHRGDRLQGLGGRLEEQIVERFRLGGEGTAQFFRHGEGPEEVGDRQEPFGLLLGPRGGVGAAAPRTRAVMAAVVRVIVLPAIGAGVHAPAQFGRAAALDREQGAALPRSERSVLAPQPPGRLPDQPIGQPGHRREGQVTGGSSRSNAARALASLTAVKCV